MHIGTPALAEAIASPVPAVATFATWEFPTPSTVAEAGIAVDFDMMAAATVYC